jgi:serine/threonine-protein kinase
MADLYAADDLELDRRVAVKVLSERCSGDARVRERFQREASAAARLSGEPHVIRIFDVGEWNGHPFIVMELLEGGTLADRLAGGRIGSRQALAWLEQAAEALDAAHALGIVHRDVKPANLLFDEPGELRVADFGIARIVDETAPGITITGTVLGTAGYLSPEQAQGEEATAASDIYGLAVVAYELLVGRRPFERAAAAAEAAAHVGEVVPPASELASLPPAVDAVFARALAKDPAYRHESASDLVADLRAALEGDAPTAVTAQLAITRRRRLRRRLVPAALAGLLLGAGALAAAFVTGGGSGSGSRPSVPATPRAKSTRESVATTTAQKPAPRPTQTAAHKGKGKGKGHEKHEGKGSKEHQREGEGSSGEASQPPPPPAPPPPPPPPAVAGTTVVVTTPAPAGATVSVPVP